METFPTKSRLRQNLVQNFWVWTVKVWQFYNMKEKNIQLWDLLSAAFVKEFHSCFKNVQWNIF